MSTKTKMKAPSVEEAQETMAKALRFLRDRARDWHGNTQAIEIDDPTRKALRSFSEAAGSFSGTLCDLENDELRNLRDLAEDLALLLLRCQTWPAAGGPGGAQASVAVAKYAANNLRRGCSRTLLRRGEGIAL